MLCEVRVEGGIGEMEHAGAVVGHGVDRPWEVLGAVAVAVEALVVAGQLAQVRGWSRGHLNSAFRAVDFIRAYVRTDLLDVGKMMSLRCFILTAWLARLSSLCAHSMSSWTILYPFWD